MQRLIDNRECKLYHTAHCDLLNMPSCEECFVNSKVDVEQVISDLNILRSLMPAEGVTHLFTGEECMFCKGRKGKRAYYAMLDMGHLEPVREKRTVIGMKTKTDVGSILPVQISTCVDCKKRMRRLDTLPLLLPVLAGGAALLLFAVPGVSEAMVLVHGAMPFLVFLGAVLAAAVLGQVIAKTLYNSYKKLTRLDPFEIPTISHMRDKGWFTLNSGSKRPRIIFSKKRMRMGVGTGTQEEAFCDWTAMP